MEGDVDRIHIRDLSLRCIIGVDDRERREKQDVAIQVTLHAELGEAGRSDEMARTVDYRAVKKRIVRLVEQSQFFLIEALAEAIARVCLEEPRVERVDVLVEKPGALRFARTVGVEISRTRADA
ncbi:MAG: dihydroneopterin aldolase [Deltaproteobacteria bacterium]|nr:dihydroneopterin aldolase [Deltaproteobacteria bacterium]